MCVQKQPRDCLFFHRYAVHVHCSQGNWQYVYGMWIGTINLMTWHYYYTHFHVCQHIIYRLYSWKEKKKKKKMPLRKKYYIIYCNLWTHRCILFCNNRIDSKSKSNVAAYGPTRKVIKVPNKTQQQDSNHHIIKCYSTTYFCIFI